MPQHNENLQSHGNLTKMKVFWVWHKDSPTLELNNAKPLFLRKRLYGIVDGREYRYIRLTEYYENDFGMTSPLRDLALYVRKKGSVVSELCGSYVYETFNAGFFDLKKLAETILVDLEAEPRCTTILRSLVGKQKAILLRILWWRKIITSDV